MRVIAALTMLAAASLLCSGCRFEPATATPSPSATASTTDAAWLVERVKVLHDQRTDTPAYYAYCAPAVEFDLDKVTDEGALRSYDITEDQFRRLHRGDACPRR
jgi:hypothetical protein